MVNEQRLVHAGSGNELLTEWQWRVEAGELSVGWRNNICCRTGRLEKVRHRGSGCPTCAPDFTYILQLIIHFPPHLLDVGRHSVA